MPGTCRISTPLTATLCLGAHVQPPRVYPLPVSHIPLWKPHALQKLCDFMMRHT